MARIHEPLTIDTRPTPRHVTVEEPIHLGGDTVQVWSQEDGEWLDCEIVSDHTVRLPDDWSPVRDGESVCNDPHRIVDRSEDYEADTTPGEQVDLREEYVDVERQIAEQEADGQTADKWLLTRRSCIRQKLLDEGEDVPETGKLFDDEGAMWFDAALEHVQEKKQLRQAYNDAREKIRRLEEKLGERGAAE